MSSATTNATATIYTYTIIRIPPQGFEGAPYCVAIVNTGDVLETARIAGFTDGIEINVGDSVSVLAEPDANGATYTF